MLDLSMNQFKKALGYGQRTNKFYIRFPEPFQGVDNITSYLVQSASVPTKGVGVVTIPWQGVTTRLPGDPEVSGSWTATFRMDDKNEILKPVWAWLTSVVDSLSNSRSAIADVIKDVEVKLLDVNMTATSTFKLLNMFPTEVGEITNDYTSENAITTFTVTFAYSDIAYSFT